MIFLFGVMFAPIVALSIYFYHRDKYEKEPLDLLLKTFLWGCVSVVGVILVQTLIWFVIGTIQSFLAVIFLRAFVVAACVEEGFKFIIFKRFIYPHKEFNEPYDGILYAVMISLGFAMVENIGYVLGSFSREGLGAGVTIGILRAFTAVPAHAFFAVLMGYFFGLAKFTQNPSLENKFILQGLGVAIFVHGLYDFLLFTNTLLGLLFVILLLFVCLKLSLDVIRAHQESSPFKK
jgi:RsiW-degrading membrane proteinase PrsW (M82 family)